MTNKVEYWQETAEGIAIKKITKPDGRVDAYSFALGDNSGTHDHMWIPKDGKPGYHPPR